MSWKITKKLKETHLAPIANPFGRSSSTSTIVSGGEQHDETPPNASADPRGIVASQELINPEPVPYKPSTLIVTLHEGRGFALPESAEASFNGQSASGRPNSTQVAGSVAASYGSSYSRPRTAGASINNAPTNHGRYLTKYLPYAVLDFEGQQVFVNSVSGSPENPLWAGDSTPNKFDVSRVSDINLSFYIRNPSAPPNSGRSFDIFLGSCKLMPDYFPEQRPSSSSSKDSKSSKGSTSTNGSSADKPPRPSHSGLAWSTITGGTGNVKVGLQIVDKEEKYRRLEPTHFEQLKTIGKGSFGIVYQVRYKETERIYAMKQISKKHVIERSEVTHTMAERSVLAKINNPFIVPLKFSFQSPSNLYLVLAFVNGGELFHHLQREQRFEINRARFYTAELLCALECLHGFNIMYRDLKPENILLDYTGHVALCDFGLCKLDMKEQDKTNTFCGTPEYLAPEVLLNQGYTKAIDWWTLGVLLYEMLTGLPPYYDENTNEMYRKILYDPLTFPENEKIMPAAARDLLTKLLDRNPETRLGAKDGAQAIKAHPFFDRIDWRKLLQRKYEPTFKPNVESQLDTSNFDREFTSEAPRASYGEDPLLSTTAQAQFAGWSYTRPVAGLNDAGGSIKDPSFEALGSKR